MDETKKTATPAEPSWSRRKFLGAASTAAAGLMVVPRHVVGGQQKKGAKKAPSDTLNIACVGVGGMGAADTRGCRSQNIVALCDVDDESVAKLLRRDDLEPNEKAMYDKAAKYRDFRRMLEKEKGIDAITVSTPDHNHAVIAMAAIKLGKHVYVQKPLTHTIKEARTLAEAAKAANVVTQMGNQGHAGEGARLVCEWIRDGAIGNVFEVHCWTNRPIWPQGEIDPSRLPPLQVARTLGLRHRRARRHGRPHHGPALLGPGPQGP
ncbi:MAG: iolG 6, partial [Candidatus Aminicenantes bacterium]|nr:iolG 6 [Candidatus Aminicenantes bacterium]